MDLQNLNRLRVITVLLLILAVLNSCTQWERFKSRATLFKEDAVETIKVYLSSVPIIRRWISLHPPPRELYKSTEEKITQLKFSQAKDRYSEEYDRIIKKWDEANRDYRRKFYKRAERKLKNVQRDAEGLLKKIEEEERVKRERALALYKRREEELLANLPKREEERLKVRIYLWKLRNLIELKKYEEFEREIEKSPL